MESLLNRGIPYLALARGNVLNVAVHPNRTGAVWTLLLLSRDLAATGLLLRTLGRHSVWRGGPGESVGRYQRRRVLAVAQSARPAVVATTIRVPESLEKTESYLSQYGELVQSKICEGGCLRRRRRRVLLRRAVEALRKTNQAVPRYDGILEAYSKSLLIFQSYLKRRLPLEARSSPWDLAPHLEILSQAPLR